MAQLKTRHSKITAVCCALPEQSKSVFDIGEPFFDKETIAKRTKSIGTEKLYFAAKGQTSEDLCFAATERLLEGANIAKEEVDGLLFLSQTPKNEAPATSNGLAYRLGFSEKCLCLDINLGCSAFVYAYFLASNLIETAVCKKVIILIGDTLRERVGDDDIGLTFIISDGASAVLVERIGEDTPAAFVMKSDGSGKDALVMPRGENLVMDGMTVFTFACQEVPIILEEVAALLEINLDSVDLFLLHQANAYMLKYISKRANIPPDKVPINIERYGNTNGSTIPFLLCDLAMNGNFDKAKNVILCGFGIGLSWGAAATTLAPLKFAEFIKVKK